VGDLDPPRVGDGPERRGLLGPAAHPDLDLLPAGGKARGLEGHHIVPAGRLDAFDRADFDTLLAAWRAGIEHDPRSRVAVTMMAEWSRGLAELWTTVDAVLSAPHGTC
jgi:hypothetical protein